MPLNCSTTELSKWETLSDPMLYFTLAWTHFHFFWDPCNCFETPFFEPFSWRMLYQFTKVTAACWKSTIRKWLHIWTWCSSPVENKSRLWGYIHEIQLRTVFLCINSIITPSSGVAHDRFAVLVQSTRTHVRPNFNFTRQCRVSNEEEVLAYTV